MHRAIFPLLSACLIISASQQPGKAQTATVLNAASFSAASVAPGSIVTIFGSNLATAVQAATDSAHPPSALGGTAVTVGGVPASLFYVSPTQINAVVGASVTTGTEPVVITSAAGVVNSTVVVAANAQPGLFSLTGTGTHDGAIIDALTGRIGAFSVQHGSDSTYLSLFLTGANLTTTPVVTVGGVAATVTYAGVSPCCLGLQQINLTLPASLAGAGRVAVTVQAAGQISNVVEIVLLPAPGKGESQNDSDNQTRSRELSAVATVPGTSLALVSDENDDVVREVDIAAGKVVHTIALAADSEPSAIAVNAAGTVAVVAERESGKVAIVNLTSLAVQTEIATGAGPVAVAISGTQAVVVNGDNANISVVDLTAKTVLKTIAVGLGPRAVALDGAGLAYVTNENDGTISVVDLNAGKVTSTITLTSTRPSAIQLIAGTPFAIVTDRSTTSAGKVLVVNLTTSAVTPFNVNADLSGGANDVAMVGKTAYIANQTGGSVSILPLTISGTTVTGTVTTIKLNQGVRALAIDTKDNDLIAVNESTGRIAVMSLSSTQKITYIDAALAESGEGDDGNDDHSDHNHASNLPSIVSLTPASAKANTSFTMTIVGVRLTGATDVIFMTPAIMTHGDDAGKGTGAVSLRDSAFKAGNIAVNAEGTQLTATIAIATGTSAGPRIVQVATPNGNSSLQAPASVTFTVLP